MKTNNGANNGVWTKTDQEQHEQLAHQEHEKIEKLVASFMPRVEVHSLQYELASLPINERYFNYRQQSSAVVEEGEEEYFLGNWRLHFKSRTVCPICLEEIKAHEKRAIPRHVNDVQTRVKNSISVESKYFINQEGFRYMNSECPSRKAWTFLRHNHIL